MPGFDFLPETCRAFRAMAPDANLPWTCDADRWGRIIDADGAPVAVITGPIGSREALLLANLIVTGVNSCAGYMAHDDNTWSPAFPESNNG